MAKSVSRIEQELSELQQNTATLYQDFQKLYKDYLQALTPAVKQQLILASYHISTQFYPEFFLKLSSAQQLELQKDLRLLAGNAEKQLLCILDAPSSQNQSDSDSDTAKDSPPANQEQVEENSSLPSFSESAEPKENESNLNFYTVPTESSHQELTFNLPNLEEIFQSLKSEAEKKLINEAEITEPMQLNMLLFKSEKKINQILQSFSRKANRLLQQYEILPKKLPDKLLEITGKPEPGETAVSAGPPNLLNVMVEADVGELELLANYRTSLTVIHLRLSEIEFREAGAMAKRNQIRSLEQRLHELGRQYQKKQRELSVAKAENAWRSGWFDS